MRTRAIDLVMRDLFVGPIQRELEQVNLMPDFLRGVDRTWAAFLVTLTKEQADAIVAWDDYEYDPDDEDRR